MIQVKINGNLYPATVAGRMSDKDWDGRDVYKRQPLRYLNTIFQQLSRFSIVHISRTLNTATIKFCPNSLPVSP